MLFMNSLFFRTVELVVTYLAAVELVSSLIQNQYPCQGRREGGYPGKLPPCPRCFKVPSLAKLIHFLLIFEPFTNYYIESMTVLF